MTTFRTVAERASAAFEVRGSEFIGHTAPAASREEAEAFVDEVRAEYDDATHNVPAYRVPADGATRRKDARAVERRADGVSGRSVGESGDVSGASGGSETGNGSAMLREYADDDGEPSGSAGDPAVNVLRQREVRNVVVVVTRYYGGTNLGVGGLARAYSRATSDALDAAGVVERRPHERFRAEVAYDDSGTVRGLLERADCEFEADYDERVTFAVRVPVPEADALRDRLRSATSGRVELS